MSVVYYLDPQTTFFWSTGVKSMKIFVRYLLFILPSFCCSIVVNQLIFVYTGHDAVGNADAAIREAMPIPTAFLRQH